jgi:hypothetical protein
MDTGSALEPKPSFETDDFRGSGQDPEMCFALHSSFVKNYGCPLIKCCRGQACAEEIALLNKKK